MTQQNREHIDTILVYRENFPEPDGVFVSLFEQQIGLGVAAGGDVEVWLSQEECQKRQRRRSNMDEFEPL
jgi:hypothetical protein